MTKQQTILVAHYDASEMSVWRGALENEGFRVQATASGADVLRRMDASAVDAVVLEPLLPRLNGLSVLKAIKGRPEGGGIPSIVVIDDGDSYTENRALISGADAIVKRSPDGSLAIDHLVAKIRSLLVEQALVEPRTPEMAELQVLEGLSQAGRPGRSTNPVLSHITDSLTGLFNSDYLDIKLAEEFKRSRRFGLPMTAVVLEIRGAKADVAPESDPEWRHVLNEVAGTLLCESRDIDVLARDGSSSFCLVLPNTNAKGGQVMAERILAGIMRHFVDEDGGSPRILAAAGLAEFSGKGMASADDLRTAADEALRTAWRRGAYQVQVDTAE